MRSYSIRAEWDGEAEIWVASSDDVPGLATGADTFEELIEKLKVVVPELLEENGLLDTSSDEIPFTGHGVLVLHCDRQINQIPGTGRCGSSPAETKRVAVGPWSVLQ